MQRNPLDEGAYHGRKNAGIPHKCKMFWKGPNEGGDKTDDVIGRILGRPRQRGGCARELLIDVA